MKSMLSCFANTQRREFVDMSSKNNREWSGFSIYLALSLEHCLSAEGASLRKATKISVCRKTVGTNVFLEDISTNSLCVCPHYIQIPIIQLTKILRYPFFILAKYKKNDIVSFEDEMTTFSSTNRIQVTENSCLKS